MLGVTVIALGKLKEKYLRDACDEYIKRLGTLCKLKIHELDPVKLGDNASQAEIDKALEKESKDIFSKIFARNARERRKGRRTAMPFGGLERY